MKEIIFPNVPSIKGPPHIRKNGIIYPGEGEMSVFIHKGRLKYLVNDWQDPSSGVRAYAHTGDYLTREEYPSFGNDEAFYQAYCENDVVYVFATVKNSVYLYTSEDLIHWSERKEVLKFPENFTLFNTAVCKDDKGYVMAIECGYTYDQNGKPMPNEYIGSGFTEFFARADDLEKWTLLPFEKSYTCHRYNACPALEYLEGYYYMICLEELPALRYAPYIYRTKDFDTWEIGFYNPLFVAGREDLVPKEGVEIPQDMIDKGFKNLNTNNSDVDLCEYEGKTYIFYCSGNQGNTWGGIYCEAVYDGALADFLKDNFR